MKSPDNSVIRIGAWRVDPALDEISKDGQTIKLEPKTMCLLLCLAKHAGKVVSVEQLLDEVWKGVIVTSDSVYHAVAALRRVLGDDTKDPSYIANVLRRGYRLVAPVVPWVDVQAVPRTEHSAAPEQTTAVPARGGRIGQALRRFGVAWIVALGMMLVLSYFTAERLWLSKPDTAVEYRRTQASTVLSDKTVAVLPFVDMSEKKDQEYFADGLSEELIYLLSRAPGLYVPAITSSFYFKGKQTTISDIAKSLGVGHVLEGSVRKSGNTLRITAQLIRVDNGQRVWSDTFDRQLNDVFKVQDEIASAVAEALQVSLLAEGAPRDAATIDTDAYTLLLQARFYDYRIFTKESEQQAVDYYKQVVRLDPSSAAAWEGLSRSTAELPSFGVMRWQEGRDEALRAAERAVAIDPKLPAAHIALGKVRYIFDWDWSEAQSQFEAARALDPRDAYALFYAGQLATTVGRSRDALQLFQQAILQDPLNHFVYMRIAAVNYKLGRFAESEAAARKAVELLPTGAEGHALLGQALLARGARDAALAEIERESYEGLREWARARIYWLLGQKDKADAALTRLETGFAKNMAYRIAEVHALRAEPDQSFEWLGRAYQQRDVFLIYDGGVMLDPDLNTLRQDRRYKALLRQMKLPE